MISKVHWSFWLIGAITLLWNILGSVNFLMQMNPEMIAAYRESERAIIEGRPIWATLGFGLAVFGGSLGCLLLLLRRSAALYLFLASLVGVIVATFHTLSIGIDFSIGEYIGIIFMPFVVAVFLIWYSIYITNKSWTT